MDYLQRAGQQAVERSAYAEAISHLTAALDLLTTLPETRERNQQGGSADAPRNGVEGNQGLCGPEVERLYTGAACVNWWGSHRSSSACCGDSGWCITREANIRRRRWRQLLSLAQRLQTRTCSRLTTPCGPSCSMKASWPPPGPPGTGAAAL